MSTNGKRPPDAADHELPDDLRILRDRLADFGIGMRVPGRCAEFDLPEPLVIEGEPVTTTLLRMRDGDLPRAYDVEPGREPVGEALLRLRRRA